MRIKVFSTFLASLLLVGLAWRAFVWAMVLRFSIERVIDGNKFATTAITAFIVFHKFKLYFVLTGRATIKYYLIMEKQQWLEWRHNGLGSSDSPIIMGVSPYKTRKELWREKTGPLQAEKTNFITEKGHRLEPIARRKFAAEIGMELFIEDPFEPAFLFMEKYPFLKASLDGLSKCRSYFIEIKFVGKDVFNHGQVPPQYIPQIDKQFLVSGCKEMYFIMINDELEIKWFKVLPDPARMAQLLAEEILFWECVVRGIEPADGPEDFRLILDGEDLAAKYILQKNALDAAEEALETTKKELLKLCTHSKNLIGKLKITEVERAGNVDYKKIPELKDVNLEKYRNKPSKYWKIST